MFDFLGSNDGFLANSSHQLVPLCNWPNFSQAFPLKNVPNNYVEVLGYPSLLTISTVVNSLLIARILSSRISTAVDVQLFCIAVADIFVIWLALYDYLPEINTKYLDDPPHALNHRRFRGIGRWWQDTTANFADWTVIAFSLNRVLAFVKPKWLHFQLSVRQGVCLEVCILTLCAIFSLERLVFWNHLLLVYDDGQGTLLALRQWEMVQDLAEVVMFTAKWMFLVISNIVLACYLVSRPRISNFEKLHGDLRVLASVAVLFSVLYSISQLPNFVYKVLVMISRPPYCVYNLHERVRSNARPFVHMALLTNYSINFAVFCLVWAHNRHQLQSLFGSSSAGLARSTPVSQKSACAGADQA
ncbi:hypothetical protein BV898_01062 [Hypsibius exemplaris]|uniref:G-protein coupled receptors family 1 profile domain-containing protein n=1 Tax=Hypsibius exemplaris TaxID=2072580 RepID=A0A1W0XD26_HYPEX|nr:hypothetical protein BV898_01062 [Hypsibius exemplaris]